MNLLFSNDRQGQYPESWYAATTAFLPPFAPLQGAVTADVCIVGGGYTGLSAALELARAGRRVVLLEAHRVGFGASGRNGGQLGSGQRVDQQGLERLVGRADAAKYWALGEAAKALVKRLISDHDIECQLKPGVAWTGSSAAEVAELHGNVDFLRDRYGYDHVEALDEAACRALCPSPDYKGGMIDRDAAHLHPLRLAVGLARAAAAAGAAIHEGSCVHHVAPGLVQTADGRVKADHVILAGNGYLGTLDRKVRARVMPINNFVVATEPLGAGAAQVLTEDVAVADSRFVVNYFRLSHDRRLLFGGGESYGYRFPKDIAAKVRRPMAEIFPHLKDVRIDYAWGGTLAITMKRLPFLARVAPGVLSASGYSGHGVGTATHAGWLMARAIMGEQEGFETMSALPAPAFPGGGMMRTPLLTLAMSWYALRDRLGI
ncbi:FAD-binding oxidoreductase [Marinovum sp. SP66]|jgi:gamma-glutamylputrescine oxidase|uniref:NAD(P)/FAD-dependent oxidoreductase n=1 Tax=Marinovum TaxID=367771 RepID=UPI00237B0B53|nr:FAD-binding oxidoreductase [Marinovum sp. SP66]MDD9740395.1 FAD-binding oxidoreductase [Marinovum sp. SP66]